MAPFAGLEAYNRLNRIEILQTKEEGADRLQFDSIKQNSLDVVTIKAVSNDLASPDKRNVGKHEANKDVLPHCPCSYCSDH